MTSSTVVSSAVVRSNTDGFKSLVVWQRAMDFAFEVYRETEHFPKHELYGIVSQLRRAAASAPANIAEGYGRNSRKEELHFLSIANASLNEVETFLILAGRLGYIDPQRLSELDELRHTVARLLVGYRKSKQQSGYGAT